MDEEPNESLRVRTKVKAETRGITVGVCYRPLDQEEQENETLYRQTGASSPSQTQVLLEDFNPPSICCTDNTAGNKPSRRFLACVDDNFLNQVIEEPTRRGLCWTLSSSTGRGSWEM